MIHRVVLLLFLATAVYAGSFNPAYTSSVSVSALSNDDINSKGRHADPAVLQQITDSAPAPAPAKGKHHGPHGKQHAGAPRPASHARGPSDRPHAKQHIGAHTPRPSHARGPSTDRPHPKHHKPWKKVGPAPQPAPARQTADAPAVSVAANNNKLCPSGYKLAWNDEFDTYSAFNRFFTPQLYNGCQYGICGWGNDELEWYTNRTSNVDVKDGKLVITARASTDEDKAGCCDGADCKADQCNYTSGRVRTYTKYSVAPKGTNGKTYVRISARIQFPVGAGLWPSFSMLPEDSPVNCSGCGAYGSWSASGAITVAQAVNDMKSMTGGINFGGPFPNSTSATFNAPLKSVPYSYHLFELEWSLSRMKWYVDGKKVFEALSGKKGKVENGWYSTGPGAGTNSPFDKPFYLIFNLAVGGTGVGGVSADDIAATMAQPKQMKVDYVRVCTK